MGIRARFAELVNHLKTKAMTFGIPSENFQREVANMKLAPGGRNLTSQGWHLANLRYRGVLLIERIPQQQAIMLMIHARTWLDDFDDTRGRCKLDDPDIDFPPLDSGDLVDVLFACDFVDPVYLAESPDGVVDWNGIKLDPVDYDLWIAEGGTVNSAPINPEG